MDAAPASLLSERRLELLEQLLRLPGGDMKSTLSHASDAIAGVSGADKVDAFLYDGRRDCLVAVGSSTQPLSALQRQLGLDVLQISNGGRVVHVYKTGETYLNGAVDQDLHELPGIRQGLRIKSKIGVPLIIAGAARGVLVAPALQPEVVSGGRAGV